MTDPAAALRPIDDAAAAIDRLQHYGSPAELASAIEAVWAAVQRALRLRLRADRSAPEAHRLSALSEADLPLDDVVASLRARDLISIETAGGVHALRGAADRAAEGQPRPDDADHALDTVERIRANFSTGQEAPAAKSAEAPAEEPPAEPDTGTASDDVPPERRGRWVAMLAAGLALLFLVALGWMLLSGPDADLEEGVAAFRAGRLDSAAVAFQRVLEDRPRDVGVLLYLGRIHRRLDQPAEAAEVLRRAVAIDPRDSGLRRELGHLFMDLDRPGAAAEQYERALEEDADDVRNWAGLIRALRASSDPRAEQLLDQAPAEVQALLSSTRTNDVEP